MMSEKNVPPDGLEPQSQPQNEAEATEHTDTAQHNIPKTSDSIEGSKPSTEEPTTIVSSEQKMTDKKTVEEQQTSATQPQKEAIVIKQGGGKGMAFGAVVLSMLALGASGFLFVQGQNALKSIDTVWSQKINDAGLGQSQNSVLLQDTLLQQGHIKESIGQLNQMASQNEKNVENLNNVYQELLKGRDAWLVNEAEYALNIASQQLLLAGNVPAATATVESISNRLNQFDKPQLLPIKKALSEDLATLKNMPYVDVASASLRLDRLEFAVSSMPLVVESTLQQKEVAVVATAAATQGSWWERSWQEVKDTLGSLVQVRKIDNKDAMLISPEQSYFVRENVRLRLIDARIALLQHSSDIYRNDLDNVEETVRQYFDVNAPTVKAWLDELDQLKKLNLQKNMSADILQNSINAVRQYQEQVLGERSIVLPDSALVSESASEAVVTDKAASAPEAGVASKATPNDAKKADTKAAIAKDGNETASAPAAKEKGRSL